MSGRLRAISIRNRFPVASRVIDVTQAPYYAKFDGVTDDTAAINAAIVAAATGNTVLMPAGTARILGTIVITNAGVTLQGAGRLATILNFNNGALDSISVSGNIYGTKLRDFRMAHSGKTGGAAIKMFQANLAFVDSVDIDSCWNGFDIKTINNVTIRNCTAISYLGAFGLKYYSLADGTQRSDVLVVENTVFNTLTAGADGIVWDGLADTLRLLGVGIINCRYGLHVLNTAASSSFYPQFLVATDLEIDGATSKALFVEGGSQFIFNGCDFFIANAAAGPAIDVTPDTGASFTNTMRFTSGRIGGGQGKLLSYNAKGLTLAGAVLAGGSGAGSGIAEVIAIGAAASDIVITGSQIGAYFGTNLFHSYGITVAAGALRVTASNNDFNGCVTGEVLDNSGSSTVFLGGGLNKSGVASQAMLGTFGVRRDWNGGNALRVDNATSGASASSGWVLSSGTANSFRSGTLLDNGGSPFYIENGGSAIVSKFDDADTHTLRNNAGSAKLTLTAALANFACSVKTLSTTVAGLPAAATAGAGARAHVTDATVTTFQSIVAGAGANPVPVYSDGTNWRIG